MWSETVALGQDRSETKNIGLGLGLAHCQPQSWSWCCFVKHDLVTLVVIMILKDTETLQVLFIVSLFCAWNITLSLSLSLSPFYRPFSR